MHWAKRFSVYALRIQKPKRKSDCRGLDSYSQLARRLFSFKHATVSLPLGSHSSDLAHARLIASKLPRQFLRDGARITTNHREGQSSGAIRRWKVRRMRSARRRTPNLLSRLETWNFTVRSAMLSLPAISLFERVSRSESRTSCSRRLRLATESDLSRRVWPARIESTKPERRVRGTQKPPLATSGRARTNWSRASL